MRAAAGRDREASACRAVFRMSCVGARRLARAARVPLPKQARRLARNRAPDCR
ncbi:selenophosphate synthetase [Burkholderia pseudomallei]|nr:selenophosphate synthetase [Burkholderia pseudomallei]